LTGDTLFVSLVFNLVCFGVAVMWMLRGCRDGSLRETVRGSLLLAAVVLARYFDLFESLAMRGLVFLVLGGLLVGEGFYYRRLRRADARDGGAA
jgi:predicted membrane channel-forming protein YqfA (hemolysin III family)